MTEALYFNRNDARDYDIAPDGQRFQDLLRRMNFPEQTLQLREVVAYFTIQYVNLLNLYERKPCHETPN